MTLRIEVTFSNGMKQELEVNSVLYLRECAGPECPTRFKTEYPHHVYCSNECAKDAANLRYKSKSK